jgi:hypothetical protein
METSGSSLAALLAGYAIQSHAVADDQTSNQSNCAAGDGVAAGLFLSDIIRSIVVDHPTGTLANHAIRAIAELLLTHFD